MQALHWWGMWQSLDLMSKFTLAMVVEMLIQCFIMIKGNSIFDKSNRIIEQQNALQLFKKRFVIFTEIRRVLFVTQKGLERTLKLIQALPASKRNIASIFGIIEVNTLKKITADAKFILDDEAIKFIKSVHDKIWNELIAEWLRFDGEPTPERLAKFKEVVEACIEWSASGKKTANMMFMRYVPKGDCSFQSQGSPNSDGASTEWEECHWALEYMEILGS